MIAYFARTGAGTFSFMVLLTLAAILVASVWVFATLVRRETRHRRLTALTLWARSRKMRLNADPIQLGPLKQFNPKVLSAITGESITLAQIETADVGVTNAIASRQQWNVLLCKLTGSWPTTALRPTANDVSLVDLFSLSSYPSLAPTGRFIVFGVESRAAGKLAESSSRALLPADVALVLHENNLILDFSSRHFDQIEFDRLIDLAEQLAPLLLPGN